MFRVRGGVRVRVSLLQKRCALPEAVVETVAQDNGNGVKSRLVEMWLVTLYSER